MEQIAFGPFRLEVATNRLLRDGVDLELRPQAFYALKALIQNSGRHVGYDQMISQAWDGNLVSKHTVAVTIGEVKKVLREYGGWIRYRPKLGYRLDVPRSEDLLKKALHFSVRHTREGLEKALDCYQQAAQEDNGDFRAFQGISNAYLMLGTYGMRPSQQMYAGFLEAHRRAVGLCGMTPALRGDRAHGLHVFERNLAEAESELLQAMSEDATVSRAYIRLAMLYATMGRLEDALDVLAQAQATDALWPTLPQTELFIQLCRREFDCAVECGKRAVELHPYLNLGRAFYAQALEYSGQAEEALAEYRRACVLAPDLPWLRALEARFQAKIGRREEALAEVEQLEQLRLTEYVDAYFMALVREELGQRDEAFRELERAYRENSATFFIMDVDPKMDGLRADARFASLRNRVFATTDQAQAADFLPHSFSEASLAPSA
jgi:tetratricopeptide (TPR) repeat protein